jgi:hypothetical protein
MVSATEAAVTWSGRRRLDSVGSGRGRTSRSPSVESGFQEAEHRFKASAVVPICAEADRLGNGHDAFANGGCRDARIAGRADHCLDFDRKKCPHHGHLRFETREEHVQFGDPLMQLGPVQRHFDFPFRLLKDGKAGFTLTPQFPDS